MKKLRKNLGFMLVVALLVGCGSGIKEPPMETVKEIVLDTLAEKEGINETARETVKETVRETVQESVEESKKETVEEKGKETINEVTPSKEKKATESIKNKSVSKTSEKSVKKKSNKEIAKEVLNGEWGTGSSRKSRLEKAGYNYNEIQTLVNEMVPATPVEVSVEQGTSQGSNQVTQQTESTQAFNSVMINGYELPISNVNTQARLDAKYQELVNWGSEYVGHKTVGGGSIYLAVHRDSYGWLVQQANSITFKDINGNTKTYYRVGTVGPLYAGEEIPDDPVSYLYGNQGDAIAIQTCIDGSDTVSYAHIFR